MYNFLKSVNKFVMVGLLAVSLSGGMLYSIHLANAKASASTFRVVQTPKLTLYGGISSAVTAMRITPYPKDLDGVKLTISDLGTFPTVTVDPGLKNIEEIIGFTSIVDSGDNTATLLGLSRNLSSKYPYTSSGTGRAHNASAQVVFSNNPQIYGRLAAKENAETITGAWTFSSWAIPGVSSTTTDAQVSAATTSFATVNLLNGLSIAGAPNGSTIVKGIYEQGLASEASSSATTGGTGANLVVGTNLVSGTPGASLIPIAQSTGKLLQGWFDLAANWAFSGNVTISGTSTHDGVVVGGVPSIYSDGNDGDVTISSGTTTLTRDMYYHNLTINSGQGLAPNGFKVYVSGTLTNNGTIARNGNSGGNGSAGSAASGQTFGAAGVGGTGGAGLSAGTLASTSAGLAGSAGAGVSGANAQGNGGGGTSAQGIAGESLYPALGIQSQAGVNGGNGGAGGAGGNSAGTGGAGGDSTGGGTGSMVSPFSRFVSFPNFVNFFEATTTTIGITSVNSFVGSPRVASSGGGSGGGGGGGGNTGAGGGGGGGGGSGGNGSNGGVIVIYARIFVNSSTGSLLSRGGNGGNGANGGAGGAGAGNCGGGGGGGGTGAGGMGGSGGVIVVVSSSYTNSGVLSVTGGTGGTAGATPGALGNKACSPANDGSIGVAGTNGSTGLTGKTYLITF